METSSGETFRALQPRIDEERYQAKVPEWPGNDHRTDQRLPEPRSALRNDHLVYSPHNLQLLQTPWEAFLSSTRSMLGQDGNSEPMDNEDIALEYLYAHHNEPNAALSALLISWAHGKDSVSTQQLNSLVEKVPVNSLFHEFKERIYKRYPRPLFGNFRSSSSSSAADASTSSVEETAEENGARRLQSQERAEARKQWMIVLEQLTASRSRMALPAAVAVLNEALSISVPFTALTSYNINEDVALSERLRPALGELIKKLSVCKDTVCSIRDLLSTCQIRLILQSAPTAQRRSVLCITDLHTHLQRVKALPLAAVDEEEMLQRLFDQLSSLQLKFKAFFQRLNASPLPPAIAIHANYSLALEIERMLVDQLHLRLTPMAMDAFELLLPADQLFNPAADNNSFDWSTLYGITLPSNGCTLSEMQHLLVEIGRLDVKIFETPYLEAMQFVADAIEKQLQQVLLIDERIKSSKHPEQLPHVNLSRLQRLLSLLQRFPLDLPSLPNVYALLQRVNAWHKEVRQLLLPDGEEEGRRVRRKAEQSKAVSMRKVDLLLTDGAKLPFELAEDLQLLQEKKEQGKLWLEKLKKSFASHTKALSRARRGESGGDAAVETKLSLAEMRMMVVEGEGLYCEEGDGEESKQRRGKGQVALRELDRASSALETAEDWIARVRAMISDELSAGDSGLLIDVADATPFSEQALSTQRQGMLQVLSMLLEEADAMPVALDEADALRCQLQLMDWAMKVRPVLRQAALNDRQQLPRFVELQAMRQEISRLRDKQGDILQLRPLPEETLCVTLLQRCEKVVAAAKKLISGREVRRNVALTTVHQLLLETNTLPVNCQHELRPLLLAFRSSIGWLRSCAPVLADLKLLEDEDAALLTALPTDEENANDVDTSVKPGEDSALAMKEEGKAEKRELLSLLEQLSTQAQQLCSLDCATVRALKKRTDDVRQWLQRLQALHIHLETLDELHRQRTRGTDEAPELLSLALFQPLLTLSEVDAALAQAETLGLRQSTVFAQAAADIQRLQSWLARMDFHLRQEITPMLQMWREMSLAMLFQLPCLAAIREHIRVARPSSTVVLESLEPRNCMLMRQLHWLSAQIRTVAVDCSYTRKLLLTQALVKVLLRAQELLLQELWADVSGEEALDTAQLLRHCLALLPLLAPQELLLPTFIDGALLVDVALETENRSGRHGVGNGKGNEGVRPQKRRREDDNGAARKRSNKQSDSKGTQSNDVVDIGKEEEEESVINVIRAHVQALQKCDCQSESHQQWLAIVSDLLQLLFEATQALRVRLLEAQRWKESVEKAMAITDTNTRNLTVHQLLQQSETRLLRCATAEMLQRQTQTAQQWMLDATRMLRRDPTALLTIDALKDFLRQGETLFIDAKEEVTRLRQELKAAKAWKASFDKFISDMNVQATQTVAVLPRSGNGQNQSQAAEDLVKRAALLCVNVSEYIDQLQQTGKSYCLCRQAYFGQMIGCDHCEDWYHLLCVGLSAAAAEKCDTYVCLRCALRRSYEKTFEVCAEIVRKWLSHAAPHGFPALSSGDQQGLLSGKEAQMAKLRKQISKAKSELDRSTQAANESEKLKQQTAIQGLEDQLLLLQRSAAKDRAKLPSAMRFMQNVANLLFPGADVQLQKHGQPWSIPLPPTPSDFGATARQLVPLLLHLLPPTMRRLVQEAAQEELVTIAMAIAKDVHGMSYIAQQSCPRVFQFLSIEDVAVVIDGYKWMTWCSVTLYLLRFPPPTPVLRRCIDATSTLRCSDEKIVKLLTSILTKASQWKAKARKFVHSGKALDEMQMHSMLLSANNLPFTSRMKSIFQDAYDACSANNRKCGIFLTNASSGHNPNANNRSAASHTAADVGDGQSTSSSQAMAEPPGGGEKDNAGVDLSQTPGHQKEMRSTKRTAAKPSKGADDSRVVLHELDNSSDEEEAVATGSVYCCDRYEGKKPKEVNGDWRLRFSYPAEIAVQVLATASASTLPWPVVITRQKADGKITSSKK